MAFKTHPVTHDLVLKKDETAIKQAVSNLLYTRLGERPFNSGIGTNLVNLLFEPLSAITAGSIASEITEVLRVFEPRISIKNIEAKANFESNGFDVILTYVIIGREDNFVNLDLFLERP